MTPNGTPVPPPLTISIVTRTDAHITTYTVEEAEVTIDGTILSGDPIEVFEASRSVPSFHCRGFLTQITVDPNPIPREKWGRVLTALAALWQEVWV